jgi:hypothetical protein
VTGDVAPALYAIVAAACFAMNLTLSRLGMRYAPPSVGVYWSMLTSATVLVAVTVGDQLLILGQYGIDRGQVCAVPSGHVLADQEILAVQPYAKAGGEFPARHVGRAVYEVPARARSLAEGGDELVERQPFSPGKGHRLAHRGDHAGAEDLVGGLGGLAMTAGAHQLDRLAHRLQDGSRTLEDFDVATAHDGKRPQPGALDPTADGAIEESGAPGGTEAGQPAGSAGADRRAVDEDRSRPQGRGDGLADLQDVAVCRDAGDHDIHPGRQLRGRCVGRDPKLTGQAFGLGRAAVPDPGEQPRTGQVGGHVTAHCAEADETGAQRVHSLQ